MTQRTADVKISANVRGALAGLEQLRGKIQQTSKDMQKSAVDNEQAWNEVGRTALTVGVLAGAGIALATSKFAEFDKAMSSVQASTRASASDMGLLRDAALQAGSDTVFTATEAANAIDELAKAGVSTADILGGGLTGALDLAAAGSLNVADAAQIAATAMTQFHLGGKDVSHIADLLAAGAGKAQGSVEDLSAALNQGGLVASQTGLTIEETTGTLAAFASAGLLGSDAGTSFKTMLQRLTPISDEAKKKMDELGISAYDAQGNFVGMEKFAGSLRKGLQDLSPEARNSALNIMFGSDAVRAASVIYDQGAKGIAKWIKQVDDSGYAAETARIKLDNLSGDLEKLGGAFDTALIKNGSAANEVLRAIVQGATGAVDAFGALPEPIQGVTMGVVGLTAGVGFLSGAFFIVVPKIVEFRTALEAMPPSAQRAAGAISTVGKAFGIFTTAALAVSIIDTFSKAIADGIVRPLEDVRNAASDSANVVDDFKNALETSYGEGFDSNLQNTHKMLKGLTGALKDATENQKDFFNPVDSYNLEILGVLKTLGKTYGELASSDLPAAQAAFRGLVAETDGSVDSQLALLDQMGELKNALTVQAEQLGINVTSTDEAANKQALLSLAMGEGSGAADETAASLEGISATAKDASGKISDLADQIRGFGSVTLDANQAQRDLQQAIDDATASFEKNGTTLDITSQAGRDNMAALDGIARAAAESAAATWEKTGSEADLQAALATSRDSLIAQAEQFGMTEADAKAYADQVLATPEEVITKVQLQGLDENSRALQTWYDSWAGKPPLVLKVGITPAQASTAPLLRQLGLSFAGENGMFHNYQAFADGGFPTGIYKGRAGAIHKFAEPQTRWEAYISGKPGQEKRNRMIAQEALSRLGGDSPNYAGGGSYGSSGGNSYTTSGDTFNASFSVVAPAGASVDEQVFSAARRLKARQKVRR